MSRKQQGLRWSHVARRSTALLLRRSVPLLLAVGALLGPGSAWAGGPAPDPPTSGAPVPDAAPVARPHTTHAARAAAAAAPARRPAVAAPPPPPPPRPGA